MRALRRAAATCLVSVVVVTTTVAVSVMAAEGPAAEPIQTSDPTAAPATGGVLEITSVSPWVDADGEFQVRFGSSTQVPEGSQLTYTIHQALEPTRRQTLRDLVEATIEDGATGGVLQAPRTRPLTDYGDPTTGPVLTIPVRPGSGASERALLPNPGIHPVELVLTPPEGPELWSQVVFLNRLPTEYVLGTDDPDSPDPVRVSLVMPVQSPPTLDVDGAASFAIETRSSLESVGSLLRAVPDAPFTLGVRPNTLDGLSRTEERWSQELLSALEVSTGPDASTVVSMPYVAVDSGALVAAGAGAELDRQVDLGNEVLDEVLSASPVGSSWIFDATLTTGVLGTLRARGVDSVVVPLSALTLRGGVDEQDAMTGAVRLEGGDGVRAIAYDEVVSQRLADQDVEPGVRANDVVSMMMASWFTSSGAAGDRPPASVVLVTPTVDAGFVSALTPSLDGSGPLLADTSLAMLPDPSEEEPIAELARRDPPGERLAVAATVETRRQIESYRSMSGDAEPDLPLWERLNAESLSSELDAVQRLALHDAVRVQIADDVARIEPPRARRVVVTSRDTTIPLRFGNDLPYEVRLTLRARSPRLEIEGGDSREIVLVPGENRIDLPVVVQAPGESLLRIELMSPDEGLQIASLDVPVRSTAISGAGAALSVISLLFLVLWWIHTHRRRRREAARSGGTHPCTSAVAGDPAEPDSPGADVPDHDSPTEAPHTDSVTEGG